MFEIFFQSPQEKYELILKMAFLETKAFSRLP